MSREQNEDIFSNPSLESAATEDISSATGIFGTSLAAPPAQPGQSSRGGAPAAVAPAKPAVREVVFKPSLVGEPSSEAAPEESFTQMFSSISGSSRGEVVRESPAILPAPTTAPAAPQSADGSDGPVISSPVGGEFTQLLRTMTGKVTEDRPSGLPSADSHSGPPRTAPGEFTQVFSALRAGHAAPEPPPAASSDSGGRFTDLFESFSSSGQSAARSPYAGERSPSGYMPQDRPQEPSFEQPPPFVPATKASTADSSSFTTLIRKLDDPHAGGLATPSSVTPGGTHSWSRGPSPSEDSSSGATRVFLRPGGPAPPGTGSDKAEYSPIRPPSQPTAAAPPPPAPQPGGGAWGGAIMPPGAPHIPTPYIASPQISVPQIPPGMHVGHGAPSGGTAPDLRSMAVSYPPVPALPPVPVPTAPALPDKLQQLVPLLLLFSILLEIVILVVVLVALKH